MALRRSIVLLLAFALCGCARGATQESRAAQPELLIFAAASLTDVLQEIALDYTRASGQAVKFSFAASSALARQIESGGRVDVFMSADQEWMDYLEARELISSTTRKDVVGNRLVLVAPRDSNIRIQLGKGENLSAALAGRRIATGDPDIVPVGRYAKAALTTLGAWDVVSKRLVRADNVRSALVFVARGETPLGIVYATDAAIDERIRVVDMFPAESHPPIVYPVATTLQARPGATRFVNFLFGDSAQATFRKYGFHSIAR